LNSGTANHHTVFGPSSAFMGAPYAQSAYSLHTNPASDIVYQQTMYDQARPSLQAQYELTAAAQPVTKSLLPSAIARGVSANERSAMQHTVFQSYESPGPLSRSVHGLVAPSQGDSNDIEDQESHALDSQRGDPVVKRGW
jgi:hypothetical protein